MNLYFKLMKKRIRNFQSLIFTVRLIIYRNRYSNWIRSSKPTVGKLFIQRSPQGESPSHSFLSLSLSLAKLHLPFPLLNILSFSLRRNSYGSLSLSILYLFYLFLIQWTIIHFSRLMLFIHGYTHTHTYTQIFELYR